MSRTNTSLPPLEIEILKIFKDFESYEPDKDTYDECYKLILHKYYRINSHMRNMISDFKTLSKLQKKLFKLIDIKLDKLKNKFSGQRIITDYYKPLRPLSSHATFKCKKDDFCAQRYLEKSIREHKTLIEQNEARRKSQQEYEERVQKIKQTYRSILNIPSTVLRSFRGLSLSSKKYETLTSEYKINIWSDKIIELISELTLYNPTTCKNLDECVEKITIIIDIIHSFIQNPNIMIEYDFSRSAKTNNKYDIQKYKIYKSFLEDYNITFNDTDLQHPLFIKLNDDYKKIIIQLQKIKLDDCKNTFQNKQETIGGKSKSNLKNKKRNIKKM